ncbi:MAG TPA: efflux RND transporter permease subunit, partial [Gemmataceae bacterium]|nr:efflux RND transporter permease subunit [Gemmataceae bacterium]
IQIRDELSRLEGVGDVTYLGERDYSMRLWLDPQKLAAYGLNAADVINAVTAQNIQVAAGQIGQPPTPRGQVFQYTMTTLGRLENTEQFGDIILKSSNGSLVYMRDVASIELQAQSSDQTCTLNGKPSVALSVYQLPGSNALKVAKTVKDRLNELKRYFPPGVTADVVYDTTPFINESISQVFETLFDAVLLVAVVVLVFLQNWRSSLIPLVAVPVAVVGTFAVMIAMGFSLNNLTLFGLVLAIGIVVDDAIVVVEAVEHHIEHGMAPRDAAIKAMQQVSGPVVAIGLVLSFVFLPCAFLSGIIGQFFRQFALTIAFSTIISAFNSLTLSPALAALLLKRREKGHFEPLPWFIYPPLGAWLGHKIGLHWARPLLEALHVGLKPELQDAATLWVPIVAGALAALPIGVLLSRPINGFLGWAFRQFNRGFDVSTSAYTRAVSGLLRVGGLVLLVYGGLLILTWAGFNYTPTGFIPAQDKGYLLVNVQLPDASSVGRTQEVMEQIDQIARRTPGVKDTVSISGQSILLNANAPNFGAIYLMLDKFENRTSASLSSDAISRTLDARLKNLFRLTDRSADSLRQAGAPDAVLLKLATLATVENVGSQQGGWPAGVMEKQKEQAKEAAKTGRKRLDFVGTPEDFAAELGGCLNADERGRYQKPILDSLEPYQLTAMVNLFGPPPVEGLGTAGGFKIILEDHGDNGLKALQANADHVAELARDDKRLHGVFTSFRADTPWLDLVIDRVQAKDRGVSIDDVRTTLESNLGPYYINDYNQFGRTWQVNVQADKLFRADPQSIKQLKVRNNQNVMVPLSDFAKWHLGSGPVLVMRYDLYPSAAVNADAAEGTSSGQAIDRLGAAAANKDLPRTMRPEWTELAALQQGAGATAMGVFVLAVVLVFLVLAAQYESWSLPLAVILVVPMCLLCSIAGLWMAHQDINIFTQIGFIVLVGLACKNAILIVEFAKARREEGANRRQATLEAVKLRLRPILMTSFAFIIGVVPLVISEGAGAEMRRALGTAVFAGMLGVTLFGIFLTPVFFYMIQAFTDRFWQARPAQETAAGPIDPAAAPPDAELRPDDGDGGIMAGPHS